ncbi:MAG: hypothetical protein KKB21_04615 [Nanoarchaeota archaeon]|nr:hypothetical protein [Nanoarchaeota archaeon]MBU4086829.1 hypothetical protein [Nanoarchaeota archaeon]
MFLEPLMITSSQNISETITESASELTSQIFSSLWDKVFPLIQLLGGILVIYLFYKIAQAIASYLLIRRIKRIDNNVLDLSKKVEEILSIIKKEHKKDKKK